MNTHTHRLEELLAEAKKSPETWYMHEVWASRDFFQDRSTKLWEAAMKEARNRFLAVVAEVELEWGPPDYIGDPTKSEIEVELAIRVAYWRRDEFLACVWYEQEDTELPVAVMLGVVHPDQLTQDQ